MTQPHIAAAGDQGWQVARVMRGAGAAAKQDNCIVEYGSLSVFVVVQFAEEMRDLLAEEKVVLGKSQLPIFVAGM